MAGTVAVKFIGDTRDLDRSLGSLDGKFAKIGKAAAVGFAAAGAGLAVLAKSAYDEAREAEKIGKLTEAVVKSTGGAANVSSKQVGDLAEKLSGIAGIDDEVIQGGQNLLLTFTKVRNEVGKGNDIFDQATAAALNMSVALGQDMNSASLMLGKALNDPIKGLTALSRAGVSFTQQQKDQVKAMVAAGNTLGAQKLILKEMETQFGGAAAAAANPMDKLKVTIGNLQEKIGLAFLPVVNKAAEWLAERLPGALDVAGQAFGRLRDAVAPIIDAVGVFVDGFVNGDFTSETGLLGWLYNLGSTIKTEVLPVIERIADFIEKNWKPILIGLGVVVLGLISPFALAAAAVAAAWVKFEGFRNACEAVADYIMVNVVPLIVAAFEAIRAVVEKVVLVLTEMWDRFGRGLVDNLQRAFEHIVGILDGAMLILTGIFDLISAILTGKWGKAWEAIKEIVAGAWQVIGHTIGFALESIRATVETVMGLVSMVWSGAWNGMKTLLSDVWEGIKKMVGDAVAWVLKKIDTMLGPIDDAIGKISRLFADDEKLNKKGTKDTANIGRGFGSYGDGGVVGGRRGMPQLIVAHGGETILPTHKRTSAGTTIVMPAPREGQVYDAQWVFEMLKEVERLNGPLRLRIA